MPGLKSASGFLYEEWLIELSGDQGRRNIREMLDTSPVIGAARLALEVLMRQVNREVIPANDSTAAREVADFVDGCFNDMDTAFEDFVGEHLGFLFWGWQWYETEFKLREGRNDELSYQLAHAQGGIFQPALTTQQAATLGYTPPVPGSQFSDGKVGWRRFGMRAQEALLRWQFTPDGSELLGMWQQPPPTYEVRFVPYAKSMNFRTRTTKGNPEGFALVRNCWMAHKFSKNVMIHEGIGVERDLAGLPVAKVPIEVLQAGLGNGTPADAATYNAVKELVTNIRNDEQGGVVWPLDYTPEGKERYLLELMSSGGARQFDTSLIISRYEQRMLMAFLADFLMIGTAGPGSRALVDPRMNLFSLTGESYMRQSAGTINSRAIPQLCALNTIEPELWPKLGFGRVNLVKLLDIANYVLAISQANSYNPLAPDVKQELLRRADLPTTDSGAT
ncbi:MAG: phage portal protein family protein, partial [Acidimicrobiales bacterium]